MKTLKRAVIGVMILSGAFMYLAPIVSAVPAEESNFVTLGQTVEEGSGVTKIKDGMIDLLLQPDVPDVLGGQIKSGTVVRVLQKAQLEGGDTYYQVSTFGRGGGMIGWVTEEYIYEVLSEPPQE